jgi:hypothetical protein
VGPFVICLCCIIELSFNFIIQLTYMYGALESNKQELFLFVALS